MRQQLASASDKPNKPPSMPLPSAPPTPPGSSSGSRSASPATVPRSTKSRSRAGTVGSVSSVTGSPLSQSTVPSDLQTDTKRGSVEKLNPETPTLDLGSATAEQLRELLIARNRQCEQLTAEKTSLEKKVSQLEKEMSKKDHQIKGLMWLVANNKSPPATDFPPDLALPSPPLKTPPEPEQPQKTATRMYMRRHHLSDDSGAESHPTSGAESIRTSETSGNESSSFRRGKGRRPFMLGDSSYNFYRAAVGKRLPPQKSLAPDSALPDVPNGRSSLSSVSLPSPSSSTSSLLPPSPSLTVSSLSAIPEAPSSLRISTNADTTDFPVRSSKRISTSSMGSSSTAASSAYATNLKRSRPPSIAQVLENSPRMDDVLEKLRPFQPTA
ncbi:hypothetical protein EST38_g10471 [Candolleomyces aberdarensis]|uniref:Uncharacterized protein n=1 Tax=Candolleomyces aberdarensis TaxID=2316362 RepID=A0A4Q2DA73_9AGAR|nr:hypothetical protein EST38_g10471 [Candolleomyces aberdarensis]